jgi:hypothetical protein
MANYKLVLKNTTITDIELDDGFTAPASGQVIIQPSQRFRLIDEIDDGGDLVALINSGDIVVNDGVNDITVANGFALQNAIDYIKYPDRAFNIRFEAEPERNNNFVSKNVQEAIEEAAQNSSSVIGRTYAVIFFNNGNTANRWLFHIPTSDATDQLPYYVYWDLEAFGISFSNKVDMINCDIEFYINGTLPTDKVYTLEVRGQKYSHNTTLGSFFNANIGDKISIFVKKVGQSTALSVEVDINFRITSSTVGPGGSN